MNETFLKGCGTSAGKFHLEVNIRVQMRSKNSPISVEVERIVYDLCAQCLHTELDLMIPKVSDTVYATRTVYALAIAMSYLWLMKALEASKGCLRN